MEGYHALLDAVLSVLVVAALLVSRSSWARRFPYGLYRLEDLAAVLLALVILFELVDQARGLFAPVPVVPNAAVAVQAATVPLLAVSVWLKKRAAALLHSPGLEADAAHMVVDVAESGAVAAGLSLYRLLSTPLAYRAALLIALAGLAMAAYEAAHDSVLALLDLPREPELVRRAWRVARETAGPKAEIAELKIRWAGPAVFVDVSARMHPLLTIDVASRIASRIEEALRRSLEWVEEVRVSIEPTRRRKLRVAIPLDEPSPASRPSRHFGKAPYFLLADIEDDKVVGTRVVESTVFKRTGYSSMLAGAELAESMHEHGVTDVAVVNIGELAYALLLRHKVLVWKANPTASALDNVDKLLHGRLEPLEEPTHEAPWRREGAAGRGQPIVP